MALIYLLHLGTYSGALDTLLYSSGFGYNAPDAPGYFEPRIADGKLVQGGIVLSADPRKGGPQFSSFSVELKDEDGALKMALADRGVAGFTSTLELVDDTADYATAITLATLSNAEPTFTATTVVLNFQDRGSEFQVPLAQHTFAGSNSLPSGTEGTSSDVGGQFKPVVLGRVRQVQPPLVNSSRGIDQLHDREISAVVAVRDKGVALTVGSVRTFADIDSATDPSAGFVDYFPGDATHGAYGRRRAATMSAGPFTYDVDGDARGGTFLTTPADIAKEIVTQWVTAGPAVTDADRTALNTATGSPVVGFWNRDNVAVSDLLDQLMVSAGARWWVDTSGFRMGQLAAPAGTPTVNIRRIDGITATTAADVDLLKWQLMTPDIAVVWKVTVRYQRFWLAQTDGLDANIDPALLGQLQNEWRSSTPASDPAVLTKYPKAIEITVDTLLDAKADADALAAALLALLKVRRDSLQVDITCSADVAASIALLGVVKVYGIHDYGTSGRLMRVLGLPPYDHLAGALRGVKLWG